MEGLPFILAAVAVWRVTSMLQEETGPAGIFARFRAWLATTTDSKTYAGSIYEGYTCFYCMSVWWSFIATFLVQNTNVAQFILHWFAIAGGAALVYLLANKLEQ